MKTKNPVSTLMLVACLSFMFLFNAHAQSTTVLSSYLNIKDALVKTDPKTAGVAADELVSLLNGKTDELSKKMLVDAISISESGDVKMQRNHFDQLSQNVYTYVKKSGEKEGTIYKQYCPMANASWLASEKQINNPYFGDKMLHCGSVKEEL
jgi:hypothetical protein